ncbi:MAG: PEGA domain-containing protein [Planctomycetota bacterium]
MRRGLLITSDPPGALVHLNDVELGPTPVRTGFKYYGVYDVRLSLDGYEPLWTPREAKSPWYETPGIDAAALVLPIDLNNEIAWNFVLTPVTPADDPARASLIGRANELRDGL